MFRFTYCSLLEDIGNLDDVIGTEMTHNIMSVFIRPRNLDWDKLAVVQS